MPKPPPEQNSHSPIKVAFIVYGSIDQMSGGYLYDRRVVSALRARGDSVEVFGLSKLPYLLAPFQGLGPMLKTLFSGPGRRGGLPKALRSTTASSSTSSFIPPSGSRDSGERRARTVS